MNRVKLTFQLPKTGHYGSLEHYRLVAAGRYCDHDAKLVESSPRGLRLAEAVGGYDSPDGGWRLTPARAAKWVAMFEAGVDVDERGYFVHTEGGRYEKLSTIMEVVKDLRRAVA